MADLQTKMATYLATIYDAGVGVTANTRTDLTTLFTKDRPNVVAGASAQVDDSNTMYKVYITSP